MGGTQEREQVWGEVSNVESEVLAGNLQVEPYRTELWVINAVVLSLYGT